jgi:hypothetical protein
MLLDTFIRDTRLPFVDYTTMTTPQTSTPLPLLLHKLLLSIQLMPLQAPLLLLILLRVVFDPAVLPPRMLLHLLLVRSTKHVLILPRLNQFNRSAVKAPFDSSI